MISPSLTELRAFGSLGRSIGGGRDDQTTLWAPRLSRHVLRARRWARTHPGSSRSTRAALQASIEGLAKELMLPGAMVLLSTPQGDVVFGYGTTELGTTNPPRADTHFRAASNTKTMTAAAIVQMVQEGKLGFDDPISKYVEGVPDGDEITISQLLKMRSGLFNFTNAPELAESLDDDPDKVWTADEVLGMAFKRPPDFAPGAEYEYNNTNYYLLGLVAEKIDGKPLAAVFQDRLFGPLGMKNTALPAAASNTIPEPYAHGYLYGSTSYALADAPYPEDLAGRGEGGNAQAQRRHVAEPVGLLRGRRCHLDRRRSRDVDAGAGRGQGLQCRVPEAVAREPRGAGAGRARHAEIRLRHSHDQLGAERDLLP